MTAPPSAATAEITDESMRYHPISKVPILTLEEPALNVSSRSALAWGLVDQLVEVIEARGGVSFGLGKVALHMGVVHDGKVP